MRGVAPTRRGTPRKNCNPCRCRSICGSRCDNPVQDVSVQFHFGDYVLDTDRRELRRGSEPIAVEPQVLDLLNYLVQSRDRVVSKDDLIASVWGGRIVSDAMP